MATYRNVSKETLNVLTATGFVEVKHGARFEVADDAGVYMQVGVQGETALWEPIDAAAKAASKASAQSEGMRAGIVPEPAEDPIDQRSPSQDSTTSEGDI